MQATSTPALAQPKPSALGALTAAAILVVGIGAGAFIGVNAAATTSTAVSGPAIDAAAALRVQRNGETGALTPAQRALVDQRRGETGAAAVVAADALTSDDFLAAVGFRREHSGIKPAPAVAGPAIGNGAMIWLGTNPGTVGKLADDQMASFNAIGLSKPGADETAKVGRAHR